MLKMLNVRPALFEDLRLIEMDEATGKPFSGCDLSDLPEGEFNGFYTAWWVEWSNVQVVYGIVDDEERPEFTMVVSSWIREKHPTSLVRTAMREVPRLIDEFRTNNVWATAPDGYDYVPRWLSFIGFKATGERTVDDEAEWYRWAPLL